MKVAFLHLYLATASGDPRMILSIAKEFKSQGHEVSVYCSEFNPSFLPNLHEGLSVKIVPPKKPLNSVLGATTLFGKIIERVLRNQLYTDSAYRIEKELDQDFDFIFCENDYTYKAGAFYKKKHPNAKVVWIMNNPPFYHSKKQMFFLEIASRISSFFEAMVAKKFAPWIDWIIVYDKENKKEAENLGFKAKLIGNPLDYNYFYAPVKKIIPNQPIKILSVGALSPFRRFEDVIAATAILREAGFDVSTIIICKDYWVNQKYREEFSSFVDRSGVAQYIDVRLNGVEEEEMIQLLRETHISVVPNIARVWVATACEAMSSGLPLLITRTTSLADVLIDGENALFFSPQNPQEIADKISLLIKDPEFYTKIASAGQQYVKENLNFSEFVKEIIKPL